MRNNHGIINQVDKNAMNKQTNNYLKTPNIAEQIVRSYLHLFEKVNVNSRDGFNYFHRAIIIIIDKLLIIIN